MENLIILAVILVILAGAVVYIIKEKKKGAVCIGCPSAGECAKRRNGTCNCSGTDKDTE